MPSSYTNLAALQVSPLPEEQYATRTSLVAERSKLPEQRGQSREKQEGRHFRDAGDRARPRRLVLRGERRIPRQNRSLIINYRIVAFSRSHGERNQEKSTKVSMLSMVPIGRHRAYR
jgi:hypothetical protein